MAYKEVSETFSPINSGGYDADGNYYSSSNDYVTNSLFLEEDNFEAFDAAAISSYISSLSSVSSVTLTSSLYNSDALQHQDVGVAPLYYNNIGYQDTVLSDEGSEGAGDKNGAYNFQDLQDEAGAQVGPVTNLSLDAGTTTTSVNVLSLVQDAASASRDLIVAYVNNASNYGLTSVSSASITVTGLLAYDLPIITGTQANQVVVLGGSFEPLANVTVSDPGNPSGAGDTASIQLETLYPGGSYSDGSEGKLSVATGYKAYGTFVTYENGDYALLSEPSIADMQSDLRHLVFTSTFETSDQGIDLQVESASGGATDDNVTSFVIVQPTVCFLAGTAIATPAGDRAIETLQAGDPVLTAEGIVRPVRWLGRQTVVTRFADPMRVAPIRIRAGALGSDLPGRDLHVSPDHALMVDGVFVQAGAIVNGVSITREDAHLPERFTYFHVELADHALILAEGVPAETFIDNIDRLAFDNWADHQALDDASAPMVEMAHPRAKAHRQVPRVLRAQLMARGLELCSLRIAEVA